MSTNEYCLIVDMLSDRIYTMSIYEHHSAARCHCLFINIVYLLTIVIMLTSVHMLTIVIMWGCHYVDNHMMSFYGQ